MKALGILLREFGELQLVIAGGPGTLNFLPKPKLSLRTEQRRSGKLEKSISLVIVIAELQQKEDCEGGLSAEELTLLRNKLAEYHRTLRHQEILW